MKQKIKIVEVGARDGLQNESKILSTDVKFEFIKKLIKCGLKDIEVTSFVKPESIPQMSDSVDLYQRILSLNQSNLNFPCLVPNLKGLEIAKNCGVKSIALFSATSDSFTKKNINASVDESFEKMEEVSRLAKSYGMIRRGYVSTAFGCPYEGEISVEKLVSVVQRFFKLGVEEVSIGDTTGVASPRQVKEALSVLLKEFEAKKIAMHFHDTRGMAISNILVSLEHGITIFDSSAGGLGGCPYAQGATGNVATEDLWYLCHIMGLETGIELSELVSASSYILNQIGKVTPSKFLSTYLKTGKI
jgi:hydroxymethylglutaryl-CoA lyase